MSVRRCIRLSGALVAVAAIAGCSSAPSYDAGTGGIDPAVSRGGALGPAKSLSAKDQATAPKNRAGLSNALSRAGNTAASGGNYTTAIKMFERAHKLAPNRLEPALGLARAASAVKDHETAARAYRAVVRIDAKNADGLGGLGRELMSLREPRRAIPYLERALKQRREAWLHNELGVAFEMVGDFPPAMGEYQAGLELAPRDLTLRTNLGRALAWAGDYDAAIEILRVAATDRLATKRHRQVLSLVHALGGDAQSASEITRVDFSRAEVDNKMAYYKLVGDLARSEDRDAVAKVLAESALRSVSAFPGKAGRAVAFGPRNRALGYTGVRNSTPVAARGAKPVRSVIASGRSVKIGAARSARSDTSSISALRKVKASSRFKARRAVMRTEPPGAKGPYAYTVQLAAFRTPRRAEKGRRILKRVVPELLDPLQHMIRNPNPAFKWDRLFRLRTLAFRGPGPAKQLCASLNKRGLECLVVRTVITKTLKFETFGTSKMARAGGSSKMARAGSKAKGRPAKRAKIAAKIAKTGKTARRTAAKPVARKPDSVTSSTSTRGSPAQTAAQTTAMPGSADRTAHSEARNTASVKRSAAAFGRTIPQTMHGKAAGHGYQVQLAAYKTAGGAERGWRLLRKAAPDLLGSLGHVVVQPRGTNFTTKATSPYFRLRTADAADRLEAVRLCATLRSRGMDCIVVRTASAPVPNNRAAADRVRDVNSVPKHAQDLAQGLSRAPL